jgi:NTE family protein
MRAFAAAADRLVSFAGGHEPQLFNARIEALGSGDPQPAVLLLVPAAERDAGGPALRRVARRLLGTSLGIALGAGGARGFAHLGVMQAFARAGVEIDAIAGSSMGACIGGGLAAGWTPQDIAAQAEHWTVPGEVPFGEPSHAAIRRRIVELARERTFENAVLPFVCNATDLVTGEEAVFESGPIAPAVCASIATPGLFPPFYIDGKCYSDAALVNGLPADLLHARGHALVAAVDVFGHDASWDAPPERSAGWRRMVEAGLPGISRKVGNLRVVIRALAVAARHLVQARFTSSDLTIRPALRGSMTRFQPSRYGEYIASGADAGEPAAHDLARRRAALAARWKARG